MSKQGKYTMTKVVIVLVELEKMPRRFKLNSSDVSEQ